MPENFKKTISAECILDMVKKKEKIVLEDVIIQGDLDFLHLDLPYVLKDEELPDVYYRQEHFITQTQCVVESSIKIINSEIQGYVDFSYVVFQKAIDFSDTTFQKGLTCIFTKFNDYVGFGSAKFEGLATFMGSKFNTDVYFANAQFKYYAEFANAQFTENCSFSHAYFDGKADFYNCCFNHADFGFTQFYHQALFRCADFSGKANFGYVVFGDYADFQYTCFRSNVSFIVAHFSGDVRFSGSQFGLNAYFGSDFESEDTFTQFEGSAYFDRVTFSDNRNYITSFSGVVFGADLIFKKAHFSQYTDLKIRQLAGRLNLTDSKFGSLEFDWHIIKNHLEPDSAVYNSLFKILEDSGKFNDSDECYYMYRSHIQNQKTFYNRNGWDISFDLSKIVDIISCVSCGYGLRPTFALRTTLIIWVIFAIAYFLSPIGSISNKTLLPALNNSSSLANLDPLGGITIGRCLYFSAMILTGRIPENFQPLGFWEYVVMLESVLGYLLMGLFVVVLARKLIR